MRVNAYAALCRLSPSCRGSMLTGTPWTAARRHHSVLTDDGQGRIQIGATDSEVEHLIDSHLDTRYRKKDETGLKLLTTRREALSLYREILRYSLLFVWQDEKGRKWKDVIRANARKEFEEARFETDPEIVNRLLVTGRDCVQQIKDKFLKQRQRIIDNEAMRVEQQQRERWTTYKDDL